MAYKKKYYFEFQDVHVVTPAKWRVDILDNEGIVLDQPILLTPSVNPLLTERIETAEEKDTYVIGRQITISYEYTGEVGIPLPTEFFEANERRFRVEVRKNGILDGVYYIKPDFSEYDDKFPPFTIQLKAVDGFGYAKAVPFNVFEEDGLLAYKKVSLYEAIMTRALLQVLDADTKINVLNSLEPTNISPGVELLFGTLVHTDIFYDFVKGASSVHDVITAFAKSMYARCFICNNEVWFVRTQDLTGDTVQVDQYLNETIVNEVEIPGFVATIGVEPGLSNAVRVDNVPRIRMIPAIKKAEFEVTYKSINQLQNFDWAQWDGTNFNNWQRVEQGGDPIIINRTGAGTPENPYKLYFQYDAPWLAENLLQETPDGSVQVGDRIEISFKYRFTNSTKFSLGVLAGNDPELFLTLDVTGRWSFTSGISPASFEITRSTKKADGSFTIKSDPIPQKVLDDHDFPSNSKVRFRIYMPYDQNTMDDPLLPGFVEIYPIKLGIIGTDAKGRHITVTNENNFSQVKETVDFSFIDTGIVGLSNTIFIGTGATPAANWDSDKPGVSVADIERHMAEAHIDQYPRAVTSWEGTIYSNSIEFFNVFQIDTIPGKRFMQMSDRYNNRTCTHDILLMEIFEEGNAEIGYSEYDIEETE